MKDQDKLKLIEAYEREYYDNSRYYEFIDNGFIKYEVGRDESTNEIYVYFHDLYISPEARGTDTLSKIVDFCKSLEHLFSAKVAYCSTDKENKHIKNLEKMYSKVGFHYHMEDDQSYYYIWRSDDNRR